MIVIHRRPRIIVQAPPDLSPRKDRSLAIFPFSRSLNRLPDWWLAPSAKSTDRELMSKAREESNVRPTQGVHHFLPITSAVGGMMALRTVRQLPRQPQVAVCLSIRSDGFMVRAPDPRILSRLRRHLGVFNTELLGVLRVQPLPAVELHRLATNDAADGSSAEKAIQNIESRCASPPRPTR